MHYNWTGRYSGLGLGYGGINFVRSSLDKNYQEEWKIVMMINRADEFRS